MASSPPLLARLAGLETEYAIRFAHPAVPRPRHVQLYQNVVRRVQERLPIARARHFKSGFFLANGGALWFEVLFHAMHTGLIEGSTPECRGPRQLLAYQRAQDRMLSQAAGDGGPTEAFTLLKNDHDGSGNFYGAQENYEVTIASGFWLAVWRVGLVLLAPLMVLGWLGLVLLIAAFLVYLLLAAVIYLPLRLFEREGQPIAMFLFGADMLGRPGGDPHPHWLQRAVYAVTCVVISPVAVATYVLLRVAAFRTLRRGLTPFLVSRPILGGSGMLDAEGRFRLAQKAGVVNCLMGFNRLVGDRPLYSCGHLLKTILMEAWYSPRAYRGLFRRRQRVQICLGDSNMAETAEYLRVGTTLLVLDWIEAAGTPRVPRVRRPLRWMREIIRDPTLTAAVPVAGPAAGRRKMTALEIQRFYVRACRQFADEQDDPRGEADDLLGLWEETLDALEHDRPSLVGRIDWVTKQHLLETAGLGLPPAARRKIDLRYHELSPQGYFEQLKTTGLVPELVTPEELDRASRTPPPDTPAAMRGRHIREFSQGPEPLSADWHSVVVGRLRSRKVFRLR